MGGPAKIGGKDVIETDNFYLTSFSVDGTEYKSSEHYYQATKCLDEEEKKHVIEAPTGKDSWHRGNRAKKQRTKKEWDLIKVDTMYLANYEKFKQDKKSRDALTGSKGWIICSKSSAFWNKWNAKILERCREEFKEGGKQDVVDRITEEMKFYKEDVQKK